jgi:pSer/pThr/pTyr-binding forkhead associated (FHA) protein
MVAVLNSATRKSGELYGPAGECRNQAGPETMINRIEVEIRYFGEVLRHELRPGQVVRVGRESGDWTFGNDLQMSHQHFRIEVGEDECRVFDEGSTNSTWINEASIDEATVRDGDRLRAGQTLFRFLIDTAPASQPPSPPAPTPRSEPRPPLPIADRDDAEDPMLDSWQVILKQMGDPPADADPGSPKDHSTAGVDTDGAPDTSVDTERRAEKRPLPGHAATVSEREGSPGQPARIAISPISGKSDPGQYSVTAADGLICTLGREDPVDYVIPDEKVSARHCSIEVAGNAVMLRDLDSTNGTLLNGQEISLAKIRDGDEVQLGDTRLSIAIEYASLHPPQ